MELSFSFNFFSDQPVIVELEPEGKSLVFYIPTLAKFSTPSLRSQKVPYLSIRTLGLGKK